LKRKSIKGERLVPERGGGGFYPPTERGFEKRESRVHFKSATKEEGLPKRKGVRGKGAS